MKACLSLPICALPGNVHSGGVWPGDCPIPDYYSMIMVTRYCRWMVVPGDDACYDLLMIYWWNDWLFLITLSAIYAACLRYGCTFIPVNYNVPVEMMVNVPRWWMILWNNDLVCCSVGFSFPAIVPLTYYYLLWPLDHYLVTDWRLYGNCPHLVLPRSGGWIRTFCCTLPLKNHGMQFTTTLPLLPRAGSALPMQGPLPITG
jgi:hypothetical protein